MNGITLYATDATRSRVVILIQCSCKFPMSRMSKRLNTCRLAAMSYLCSIKCGFIHCCRMVSSENTFSLFH